MGLHPFRYLRDHGGIPGKVVYGAVHHRLNGEAAKTAFYLFLSLFPLLLVLLSVTGLIGGHAVFDYLARRLERAAPQDAARYVERFIRDVTDNRRPGVFSLGVVLSLWTGTNIFAALAQGLNRIYEVDEHRRWWRRRLVAAGTLGAALVLLVGGAFALLAGEWLRHLLHLSRAWTVLRFPVAFVLLAGLLWLLYAVLPARDPGQKRRRHLMAGSVVGTAVWFAATLGFDFYISHFKHTGRIYGLVGAGMVLLLWLYLTAYAILLGAQTAAVLEAAD
jgi:membrane protein